MQSFTMYGPEPDASHEQAHQLKQHTLPLYHQVQHRTYGQIER